MDTKTPIKGTLKVVSKGVPKLAQPCLTPTSHAPPKSSKEELPNGDYAATVDKPTPELERKPHKHPIKTGSRKQAP